MVQLATTLQSDLCVVGTHEKSGLDRLVLGSVSERVVREVVMRNRRAAETLAEAAPVTPWLAVALPWYGARELAPAPGLITVGDAAAFIDPFTGSGMLMALESSQIAARSIAKWITNSLPFESLTADYRLTYRRRFQTRLRISRWLRHAAFYPSAAATLVPTERAITSGSSDVLDGGAATAIPPKVAAFFVRGTRR